MTLETILMRFGIVQADATKLVEYPHFHHKKKTYEELQDLFQTIQRVYSCSLEDVLEAVLKFPAFAGLDHARVVRDAVAVYGVEHEAEIKKAVLKFPQFASYDHSRVVRDAYRIGKYAGLSQQKIREKILNNPVLASYSAKRYLAGLDICRTLHQEGFSWDETMLRAYFSNITKSPYVPGSKKERISHVENYQEPPLMIAMRKYLRNILNRK